MHVWHAHVRTECQRGTPPSLLLLLCHRPFSPALSHSRHTANRPAGRDSARRGWCSAWPGRSPHCTGAHAVTAQSALQGGISCGCERGSAGDGGAGQRVTGGPWGVHGDVDLWERHGALRRVQRVLHQLPHGGVQRLASLQGAASAAAFSWRLDALACAEDRRSAEGRRTTSRCTLSALRSRGQCARRGQQRLHSDVGAGEGKGHGAGRGARSSDWAIRETQQCGAEV